MYQGCVEMRNCAKIIILFLERVPLYPKITHVSYMYMYAMIQCYYCGAAIR